MNCYKNGEENYMENIVFYDFPVGEVQRKFTDSIGQVCGGHWTSYGHKKVENNKIYKQFIGIAHTFKIFFSRKKFYRIVFGQQLYGLYFLCFCRLFHVKK